MKMETELSEVLKVPVDLVMKSALKPTIGQNILQEVILV
jgi:predicted nucleotidyltransferase